MLHDFRNVPTGTPLVADLCIIGAGAAGISIARRFASSRTRVIVLEAGGREPDAAVQALYRGENVGRPYVDLDQCRLRFFGGTTGHWSGHCGPLEAIDFEPRPWIPYSGWPITRSDLDPYYAEAQTLCQLGPFRYDTSFWEGSERRFPAFHPLKVSTCVWQFSPPTRFGQVYHDDLAGARHVHVYLHASAVELVPDERGRAIQHVRVRSLDGHHGTVRARRYVLACGGIENARLLLASGPERQRGLGNRHDLVGRFFMEHPHVRSAAVLATDPNRLLTLFQRFERDSTQVRVALRPSDAAQRRERILNSSADVTPIEDRYTGYDAFREVASALRRRRRPPDFARHLREMILDFDETAGGLYGRLRGRDYRRPPEIMLHARSEQAPNRFSRVMLGSGRDALGLPTVRLQWQLSDLDKVTIRHTNRLIGEEFGRLGLGRVRLDKWLLADDTTWPGAAEATAPWEPLRGGCHHMGTTRMAGDPRHGVVGADCRVHELENLYVAGSSVFPTCGFMNPTLTIVALALRLSEHLGAPPPSRPDQPGPDRDPSRSR